MANIRPVVLSGGSGTRLWPISTPEVPKQFAPLLPGESLFGRTLHRIAGLPRVERPVVVTGASQVDQVKEEARQLGLRLDPIIVEPVGRNTAPASLAAALSSDPDDVLVILPSDHLIQDESGFRDAVSKAVEVALAGRIVTFGVVPRSAEIGYGYIEVGETSNGASLVKRFKEKPGPEEAERMVSDGRHLWNSGMFVTTASALISEASTHCPEILDGVRSSLSEPVDGVLRLGDSFGDVERISLDHAIMEKTSLASVVSLDVGWDDVGSFAALWEISEKDGDGNVISGSVTSLDTKRSYVRASSRHVAVAGLDDVIVVETADAVLVISRDSSQRVRELTELIDTD